jgi:hypothetical protein
MTDIYEMEEKTGVITKKATYSIDAMPAMIAYVEQKKGNMNTWDYPKMLTGTRTSSRKNCLYYDDIQNGAIIAAYQR